LGLRAWDFPLRERSSLDPLHALLPKIPKCQPWRPRWLAQSYRVYEQRTNNDRELVRATREQRARTRRRAAYEQRTNYNRELTRLAHGLSAEKKRKKKKEKRKRRKIQNSRSLGMGRPWEFPPQLRWYKKPEVSAFEFQNRLRLIFLIRTVFRSLPLDATPHTQASLLLVWVGIRGWDCVREIFPLLHYLHFPRTPSNY
jgi:hypothetical protein